MQLCLLPVVQADFLSLDMGSKELEGVQGVILDPSCSGSGTQHSRMDNLLPSQPDPDAPQQAARLRSLAAFQVSSWQHCLVRSKISMFVRHIRVSWLVTKKPHGCCF